MGDGRQGEDKQRPTGVAADIVAGAFSPTDVVGKRTLTGDPNSPTGDAYIDHHALCSRVVSHDCFLDPETRTALIEDYKRLVSDAGNAYQRALLSIRVDQLVKKDDELPWYVTLILDVAGAEILGGLTRTLKRLKAGSLTELTEAATLSPSAARQATATASATYIALSMVSDARLTAASKAVFDNGKKKALAELKTQYDHDDSDQKTATMSYAGRLSAIATMTFNDLATKPPGEATDAQLLVLWKSFQPPAHNQEIYKELLEEKIKRYLASGVRDIGRTSVAVCGGEDCATGGVVDAMRDTVVVRVRFKSGFPDRFAFARKDWGYDADNTLPKDRAPESQLPLAQNAFHGRPIPDEATLQRQPSFEKFIDPEFVNAAIARHMEVWGQEPETIEADDSLWTWDKGRAQQAKENTVNGLGPFGIPKLQLSSGPEMPIDIPDELRLKEDVP